MSPKSLMSISQVQLLESSWCSSVMEGDGGHWSIDQSDTFSHFSHGATACGLLLAYYMLHQMIKVYLLWYTSAIQHNQSLISLN